MLKKKKNNNNNDDDSSSSSGSSSSNSSSSSSDDNNNNRIQRRFFFNSLLTAPRTVSNTYTQVARAQSCANHVQYIKHLSRATCRVTCQAVGRDSSTVKFDRV